MKKLLMFLGVCLVAGLTQAASVTWNYSITGIMDPDWNPLDNGTIVLSIGGTDYAPATFSGGEAAGTITGDFVGGEQITATLTAQFAGGTWTQTISDWTMPAVSGDPTLDGQLLDSVGEQIALGFVDPNLGTLPDDPASAGWAAGGGGTPEPTSGLLLLIGGSLLALRRKQK